MDQPSEVTDSTGLFILTTNDNKGFRSYQHRNYPWNTIFTTITDDTTTVIVTFPPHYHNQILRSLDIKTALGDDILFANRFFQDHPQHPEHQMFQFSPNSAYVIGQFYDDFKQTFQTLLTRSGYLPDVLIVSDSRDVDIIAAYNDPNLRTYENFKQFMNYSIYRKITPEQLTTLYTAKPRSGLIYLYYGDAAAKYLYTRSQRPKTTMDFLGDIQKKENRNALSLSILSEEPVTIYTQSNLPEGSRFIPIVRYASGMRRGLFFTDTTKFCGTFYYYEPDSNFFLSVDANRYLIFTNKYSAMKWLNYVLSMKPNPGPIERGQFPIVNPKIAALLKSREVSANLYSVLIQKVASIDSQVRADLLLQNDYALGVFQRNMFPDLPEMVTDPKVMTLKYLQDLEKTGNISLIDLFMSGIPIKTDDGRDLFLSGNDYLLSDGSYAPYLSEFYASEDSFDQPICRIAFLLGIDVIIFTTMVGSARVVSEVLDTRQRDASFKAIYEIVG